MRAYTPEEIGSMEAAINFAAAEAYASGRTAAWEELSRAADALKALSVERNELAAQIQSAPWMSCPKCESKHGAGAQALIEDLQAARVERDKLAAERATFTDRCADAFVSAVLHARYGAPSSWGAENPPGWHLLDPCSPRDASMHDNGIVDAAKAIRQKQVNMLPLDPQPIGDPDEFNPAQPQQPQQ